MKWLNLNHLVISTIIFTFYVILAITSAGHACIVPNQKPTLGSLYYSEKKLFAYDNETWIRLDNATMWDTENKGMWEEPTSM